MRTRVYQSLGSHPLKSAVELCIALLVEQRELRCRLCPSWWRDGSSASLLPSVGNPRSHRTRNRKLARAATSFVRVGMSYYSSAHTLTLFRPPLSGSVPPISASKSSISSQREHCHLPLRYTTRSNIQSRASPLPRLSSRHTAEPKLAGLFDKGSSRKPLSAP